MTLYIPRGITLRPQFFTGFGGKELKEALIMAAILLSAALLFYMASGKTAITVVMVMSAIAASILFTTKDTNNISVAHQVGYIIRYLIAQKYYPYTYESIYEIKIQGGY